jgi:hypothetical protein
LKNFSYHIVVLGTWLCLLSCSHSKKFTRTYYAEHQSMFLSIKDRFSKFNKHRNFSLAFKDKSFKRIGLEIITDSIKYVYNFETGEARLSDTLRKYQFDVQGVTSLIDDMKQVHCTWITNLDYYENRQRKYLVFVSIRHRKLKSFLRSEKYFTLAYFDRAQLYDQRGRLLDRQDRSMLHRINGGLFWKIDDKVCYSLSATFR